MTAADFSEGCAYLMALIKDMEAGRPPRMSDSMRALAEEAVKAAEARKDEDIDAWAARLAADSLKPGALGGP